MIKGLLLATLVNTTPHCEITQTSTMGDAKWTTNDTDFVTRIQDNGSCSRAKGSHVPCVKEVIKLGYQSYYVNCGFTIEDRKIINGETTN